MANYYVSATLGSNSFSGINPTNVPAGTGPKATIPAGIALMASGDTLHVRAGTYLSQSMAGFPAGSPGAYTVIRGYQTERPIITQTSTTAVYIPFELANLTSGNADLPNRYHHFEIRGFEFSQVYHVVKLFGGSVAAQTTSIDHMNFIDNIVHDTVLAAFYIESKAGGNTAGDHLIQNNTFYNIGRYANDFCVITHSSSGCALVNGSWAYVPGVNCIYGTGNRTIIELNTFHNCVCAVAVYQSISGASLTGTIIRRNRIYQNARPDLDSWQIGQTRGPAIAYPVTGSGHLCYDNLIYDSGSNGIHAIFNGAGASIYNNTIYNMLTGTIDIQNNNDHYAIVIYSSAGTGHVVKNNIGYLGGGSLPGSGSHTIWDGKGGQTFANNLETNPSFQSPATGDLHLTSASTNAIDHGLNLSATFAVDYDGNARPGGGAGDIWDIGAYEFTGTPPDTLPPAAPQNVRVT